MGYFGYLKKQLEKKLEENGLMNEQLTKIQDLQEQLADIDEIITDKDMISITLNTLPISYLHFLTSLKLSLRSSLEPLKFTMLVALLLQEEQARESAKSSSDQANITKFKKKGKKHSNAKKATSSKKKKDSTFYKYCKATYNLIHNCPKFKAKEAKSIKEG